MKKKACALAVAAAMVLCLILSGCSAGSSGSVQIVDSEFSGTVESIDGSTITLSVDNSSGGAGGMGMGGGQMGTPPDMPSGDQGGSGGTPPEMPSGSASSDASSDSEAQTADAAAADGSQPQDQTPPELPSGETGTDGQQASSDASGEQATADGTGEQPADPASQTEQTEQTGENTETGNGGESSEDSDDTITVVLDLSDATLTSEDGSSETSADDIEVGDTLTVTVDENGSVTSIVIGSADSASVMGGGMQQGGVDSYDALVTYTEDTESSGETFASTGTDENAILVQDGASVKISDAAISRDSDDSTGGDNSSFYGVGAALLVTDGTAYVENSTVTTDAAGGAGIFAYSDGVAYVKDTTITTAQDTSGGLHVAGGGTLYAWNVTAETSGGSAAAIRSDRGGGTMVVDGGTYTSNGSGSPAIYSTADITVNNATLTANGSEAICIEGLNSIRLFDCSLSGNMSDNEQNETTWNVIVYQSMSGDSEVGNGTFEMIGGSLSAGNGGMFYTTNTESTFILSGVDITYAEDSDYFLRCTGNTNARGWGTTGSNGADCNFTAYEQAMQGNIIYDSISQLDFYMLSGSTLTGAVIDDESCAGDGGDGYCSLYIDSTSTWVVTGDSTVTNLYNEGTIVDADGNTVTIVGTDGTVYVQGTGSYTITVSQYSTTVDTSGASQVESFDSYAVESPF